MAAAGDVFFNAAVAGTKVAVSSARIGVGTIHLLNTTAAVAYLQVFDLPSGSVTVGTTAAKFVLGVPASAAISVPLDVTLAGGCTLAGTTTAAGSTGAALAVTMTIR